MWHKKGAMHWEQIGKLLIVILVFLVLLGIIAVLAGIFTGKLDILSDIFRFR